MGTTEDPSIEPADERTPIVDVSAALGEAGHESEVLGYEDVEDSGPVLQDAGAHEETPEEAEQRVLDAMATRGVDGVT
jgi:hypothetical protein